MAGIGAAVVSNAKFRPFSYQEMLAPLAAYTQEYNTIQEGLSNLGDASNAFGEYLQGTQAGKVVEDYNKRLQEASADMAKNGLGVTNRDTLYGLKRQYTTDILKINKAAQNIDAMYKTIQQGKLKDNSLMVGRMPTIDDVLANPSATPTTASGNEMYAHAAKSAQAASARQFLNTTQVGQDVMKYYIDNVVKTGYSPEALAKFQQMTDNIPELRDAMNDIRAMYNTQNLSAGDQIRSDAFIMRGIMDGAGYQEQHKYMENPESRAALDWEYTQKKMALQDQYNLASQFREAYYSGKIDANGNPIVSSTPGTPGAGGAGGGTEGISTTSYFDGESNSRDYNALKSLGTTKGGLSAAVFGKTYGKLNPMTIKDEGDRAYTQAYGQYLAQNANLDRGSSSDIAKAVQAGNAAKNAVLKKYGVTRFLTNDEYDTLKSHGYNSKMSPNQLFKGASYGYQWLSNLSSKVDQRVKEHSVYEVNGDEVIQRVFNTIGAHAQAAIENNSDTTVLHELDSKGKIGDKVDDWDDVGDFKNARLGYSWVDNRLILTNNGKRYAVDPSLVSNEVRDLMERRNSIYQQRLRYYESQIGRKATAKEQSDIKTQLAAEIPNMVARMASNDIIQAKGQTNSNAD